MNNDGMLLARNSESGLTKIWREDGEGNWAVQIQQDNDALIDHNKSMQNHANTWFPDKSVKMVALIPYSVIYKWLVDYGIDYWDPDPDMQRKVDGLLNSSEWMYLRTDDSVL